jgi:hypothetical protein
VASQTDVTEESPGAGLTRMLVAHRTFLESVYSLMRFLESEVSKRGWDLLKGGGYAVTRNGRGSGLASFASADWVTSLVGIAFVPAGQSAFAQGVTTTQIPEDGLQVLAFQLRWLDRAPEEPVVWYARLSVDQEGPKKPKKWEEYQTLVLNRLEPEARSTGARAGDVKPGRASIGGAAIVFTGRYGEVPVSAIESQEDIVSQLVEPALAETR